MMNFLIPVAIAAGVWGVNAYIKKNTPPPIYNPQDIIAFDWSHSGMSSFDIYDYCITREDNKIIATVSIGIGSIDETVKTDEEKFAELTEIINTYNIHSWNGFDKTNKMVMDGSSFSLYIKFADGSIIKAHGSNEFPDSYREVSRRIDDLFRTLPPVEKELKKMYE